MAVRAAIYRKKSNPLKDKEIDYKDIKTLSSRFRMAVRHPVESFHRLASYD